MLNYSDDGHKAPRTRTPQELAGSASGLPGKEHSSSARNQMAGSHRGQVPPNDGATRLRFATGVEQDIANYAFNKVIECNARILGITKKYPRKEGFDAIKSNPEITIVYEDIDDPRKIHTLVIPRYISYHQFLGYQYEFTEAMHDLYEGAEVPAGTVLAIPPGICKETGVWNNGFEATLAMMGLAAIIEDGYVANEESLERYTMTGVESRSFGFGKKMYPLNCYGNDKIFKAIPDIGERVRADGILIAFREYDDDDDALNMSPESLRYIRYSDIKIRAKPGAIVHDIDVIINPQDINYPTPSVVKPQFDKYFEEHKRYFNDVTRIYTSLKDPKNADPQLHAIVREGLFLSGYKGKDNSVIEYRSRRTKIDHYQVKVTYNYKIKPDIGFKITGQVGDKGVIVAKWPASSMPTDQNGHVADFVSDAQSTIKRMNPARFYNQYINATTRDHCEKWRSWFGLPRIKPTGKEDAEEYNERVDEVVYEKKNMPIIEKMMAEYIDMYNIISPKDAATVEEVLRSDTSVFLSNAAYILKNLPVFTRFTDAEGSVPSLIYVVKEFRKRYPIHIGPVKFAINTEYTKKNNLPPKEIVSKENILIGSEYLFFLEKTGSSWASVASSKLQHFGIPAKLTNQDKNASLVRNNPTKIFGEAEVRLLNSVDGGAVAADLVDQSNNPAVHKEIVRSILTAERPADIQETFDRNKLPLGNGRILKCTKHLLFCYGFKIGSKGDNNGNQ